MTLIDFENIKLKVIFLNIFKLFILAFDFLLVKSQSQSNLKYKDNVFYLSLQI